MTLDLTADVTIHDNFNQSGFKAPELENYCSESFRVKYIMRLIFVKEFFDDLRFDL